MFSLVGVAFVVASSSAPLLQHWFTKTDHADSQNPYFLYALSNIGSMGALLSYPLIVEPLLSTQIQTEVWRYGYLGLCVFTGLCAFILGAIPLSG